MRWLVLLFAAAITACGSAGPYGYSRVYEPNGDEERAASSAIEYDPVMAKRSPEQWKGKTVSVFGVVLARNPGSGGNAEVKLSVRTLEARNLCDSSDDDSCRVTVSDHEYAIVHALLHLTTDDDLGEHSMGPRSLVRIVGTLSDDVDPSDGEPILLAKFYRHWPRGYYVTNADRKFLRQ
ncbi:MAG TPA: hypothetical protein VH142_22390 [Polyangiaceae bacterium]|jgi:hypothetical protein|nr:hypothetical protein [Polyangiaceae bacterium]